MTFPVEVEVILRTSFPVKSMTTFILVENVIVLVNVKIRTKARRHTHLTILIKQLMTVMV